MLCTYSPCGSPLSQEAECAPQRGNVCQHPTFLTFTPPQNPRGPLSAMLTLGGVIPARERWIRSDDTSRRYPAKERGFKPCVTGRGREQSIRALTTILRIPFPIRHTMIK
eukprot:3775323-Prymnesium_polylepis.1